MVSGMATTKVTITLSNEDLAAVRALVADGHASSVSGFVQHAVRVGLQDVSGWGAMLAQALEQTGGPITAREKAWADGILAVPTRRRARRKAA